MRRGVVLGLFATACVATLAGCASSMKQDVVLAAGPTTQVQVGQSVHVALPNKEIRWTATADETRLRPLTGAGVESPPNGWTWIAIQAGDTQIVLDGRPTCDPGPCGTVPRIVYNVAIKN